MRSLFLRFCPRFFVLLFLCVGVFSFAQGATNESTDNKKLSESPRSTTPKILEPYLADEFFDVGVSLYWRKYHENFPNGKSDEYGLLYGGYAKYTYAPKNFFYFEALLDQSLGRTIYDGGVQDGEGNSVPYKGYTDNTLTDLWGKLGYSFEVVPGAVSLVPYGGGGGHLWWRMNIGCAGKSCVSYDEYYYWGYWIVGFRSDIWFGSNIRISPDFTYLRMVQGRMTIDGIEYGEKTAKLGNKGHYYGEIQTTYFYDSDMGFSITPFASSRPIGRSNDVDTTSPRGGRVIWHEPSSFTYLGGVKCGLTWAF